ncbi:membrane-associated salt-inducible protein [Perkinsela sp. CCAP 1560/4]|nr:membrane-associated salt-inducible protein [Perkinsela sp. CCAP 1560/4]|eukprot:KNH07410.1 membrane-associated salt-inducible protein [Perkinsela sp. CCAP 1560/4]
MNPSLVGHMPPYSHRTMWRTAVNVFNEAKKSGVDLDFKTYHAIMQSLTTHAWKKDSSGVKIRSKRPIIGKAPAVNISSVPSLGLWKPLKARDDESKRRSPSSPSVASADSLALGVAPRAVKPRSLITDLASSQDGAPHTPALFDGSVVLKKPTPQRAESSQREFPESSTGAAEGLKLHIPGMVKLMQASKERLVGLRPIESVETAPLETSYTTPAPSPEPEAADLSVIDVRGVLRIPKDSPVQATEIDEHPQAPVESRESSVSPLHQRPSERHRTSLNLEALPDDEPLSLAPEPAAPVEEIRKVPDIQELTKQWAKRREEELKENERLAVIEFEREEKRRRILEVRTKNAEWAEQRGRMQSAVSTTRQLETVAYKLAFSPHDESAWTTFREAKTGNVLTAEHIRIMLQRLAAHNALDPFARLLGEVQNLPIEGIDSILCYYNLLLEYRTGGFARVIALFAEMESNSNRINRRAVILTMLSAVRCDATGGWQRATELYAKYKPVIHDPLGMMELNVIQSLCMSNMRSSDVRAKALEAVRGVHNHLRSSMNQIGKLHSSALIRAYVKTGDSNTAHSIIKGFQTQGDADQGMYASLVSSCTNENIQDIIATFIDGDEVIEADLLAAVMNTYAARQMVHEAWVTFSRAKAHREFEIRGTRLALAVMQCIETDEGGSQEHVREAHNVIIQCGAYTDRLIHRIVPYFQQYQMDTSLVEAMQAVHKVYHKNIAPAQIAAYQQVCQSQPEAYDQLEDDAGAARVESTSERESQPITTGSHVESQSQPEENFDEKLMQFAKRGDWQGATSLVSEMTRRRIQLSTFQYNCVLTAAKDHGEMVNGALKHMSDSHVEPNTMTINLALNAYSRLHLSNRAWEVYANSTVAVRDLTTYNLALEALATTQVSAWEESSKILHEIRQRSLRPNQHIFDKAIRNVAPFSWTQGLRICEAAKAVKGVEIRSSYKELLAKAMTEAGISNGLEYIETALAGQKKKRKGKKAE